MTTRTQPATPAVYIAVEVKETRHEAVKVPTDLPGIEAAAAWAAAHGDVGGVCADGFRLRTRYADGRVGKWYWAAPGDVVLLISGTRQEPEFDYPDNYLGMWANSDDWVSGPLLHTYPDDDEESA